MSIQLLDNPSLRHEVMEIALASTYSRQTGPGPAGGKEAKNTHKTRDTSWLRSIPANQGLCFLYYIDLAIITQDIVHKVYSIDCVNVPWVQIEDRIRELRKRIDLWYASLPDAFDFSRKSDDGPDALRAKIFLAFHYYGARITLGRPCLCRRDARQEVADRGQTFSHEIATTAIESSLKMLDLIPDGPDAVQLYQLCPWWCILHFLMQAATVLLLELSFGCIHMPEGEMRFLNGAKKAVRWLYAMSEFSVASRRAWQLCDSNLRRIAKGMDYDVTDIPSSIYEPTLFNPTAAAFNYGPPTVHNASSTTATDPTVQYTQTDSGELPSAFNLSVLSGFPTADLMPVSTASGGMYFPYDPIAGEFIRSFFPAANEEYPWEQHGEE